MSGSGHFQTKSEALSARVHWSHPPTGADVLALGKQGRRVRLVHLFTPSPSSFSSGHHLEHVAEAERASLAAQSRRIETEAAPILYVAQLLGAAPAPDPPIP